VPQARRLFRGRRVDPQGWANSRRRVGVAGETRARKILGPPSGPTLLFRFSSTLENGVRRKLGLKLAVSSRSSFLGPCHRPRQPAGETDSGGHTDFFWRERAEFDGAVTVGVVGELFVEVHPIGSLEMAAIGGQTQSKTGQFLLGEGAENRR